MKIRLNPLGILSLILFVIGVVLTIYGILNEIFILIFVGGLLTSIGLIGSLANPYLKKDEW